VQNEASILHLLKAHMQTIPTGDERVKVWSAGLGILDSGKVQLSPDFARGSKRPKVKSFITTLHYFMEGTVRPAGRAKELFLI
jgi:hypothetical protein